jgi:hypothetical protein
MAGFKNLEDLVGDLGEGLRKLRAGALEPEELTPLVDDARELSDRLILLRFKAHEFSYEVRRKAPDGGVDAAAADRQPVRPFRIGAAYQTSLIDAIEEVSREQAEQAEKARMEAGTPELFDAPVEPEVAPSPAPMPEPEPEMEVMPEPADEEEAPLPSPVLEPEPQEAIHEEPVSQKPVIEEPEPQEPVIEESEDADAVEEAGPSIAEQMERQPISDLRTAFSLVEKYECIKMLFDDDAVEFNRVLEALEEAGTFELALHWLGQQVEAFQSWDKEDPVVLRFLDRVERRYH